MLIIVVIYLFIRLLEILKWEEDVYKMEEVKII